MKRVCHITTAHSAEDVRIFLKQCSSLVEFGYEVHLIAPASGDYQKNGVHIHALKAKSELRIFRMTQRVAAVKSIVDQIRPDIVQFHDPELLRLAFRFKSKGIKVVYDSHEDTPRQILSKPYLPTWTRRLVSTAFERYEDYVVRRIDLVLAATPSIAKRFSQLGCESVNINNYPILSEFQEVEPDPDRKDRMICYAGGISTIRGSREMIELAKALKDVKVVLAGVAGDEESRQLLEESELPENVEFVGFLSRKEVAQLYQQAMVGLVLLHPVPNHVEALPIKMFEYMAAGLPVLASNFPLWKNIVEENSSGFCADPLNVDRLTELIRYLLDHPKEAIEMGKRGRAAVKAKYNWNIEAQKLKQAYSSL